MAPGAIETLLRQCVATNRPVQALYLMQSPTGAGIKTQIAELAWLVKNKVRALGCYRLGLPCQLMGTGMAFRWLHIRQAKLNTGHIVEDMQLGIDFALNGTPPIFCPDALVTSVFPVAVEGLQSQRRRWEHGHLSVIFTQVPRLLWQACTSANGALLAMALDLCVPPLALLALLTMSAWLGGITLWALGGSVIAALLATAAIAMLGASIILAWWHFGRKVISLKQLCHVPLYVLAKLPLYFYFLVKRQSAWVRSKRDGEP
jgi:cellulose synthase/poly-beta-1,6-N-acetylglucosamine synthase-like glycosyltransferase